MNKLFHRVAAAALGVATALAAFSCGPQLKDGEYTLTLLSTNDVHGAWFDSAYVGQRIKPSLLAVNTYVDSVRRADGAGNVLLLDAGDCLQGDNAAYYYNYVDTVSPHLFPRLLRYMGYDAVAWGNHDVETGHKVYDRVNRELDGAGLPFLAGNALRNDNGQPYFPLYKMVEKAGLRIAVLGYNNANIGAWLAEEVWSGMHFERVADRVQQDVDRVRARENPDVVVVVVHSATGTGDGTNAEAEGLDVFNQVLGVDWVVNGHDHRPFVAVTDSTAMLNAGSHCRYLAHGKMRLTVRGGEIVSRDFEADLIPVDAARVDTAMRAQFRPEFETVRAFTLKEVGLLNMDLHTRDAYVGMSDYMNLIHYLCLGCAPAQLSIAAPLTYNGHLSAGVLVFNDLFTIYPFENQLYVIRMTGEELVRYLEASYDRWINTYAPGRPLLKIVPRDNFRSFQKGWSFEGLTYNFDSVAGLWYTVDVTKPCGERIRMGALADGSAFDPAATYNVAVTSYRASGGGGLLDEAGVDTDRIDERVVARYPEIRNILYSYLEENGSLDPEVVGDPAVIGGWKFVPEKLARPALKADMDLVFGR